MSHTSEQNVIITALEKAERFAQMNAESLSIYFRTRRCRRCGIYSNTISSCSRFLCKDMDRPYYTELSVSAIKRVHHISSCLLNTYLVHFFVFPGMRCASAISRVLCFLY